MPTKKAEWILIIILVWLGAAPLFSQESSDSELKKAADPQLEALMYGIDSDVLTVL